MKYLIRGLIVGCVIVFAGAAQAQCDIRLDPGAFNRCQQQQIEQQRQQQQLREIERLQREQLEEQRRLRQELERQRRRQQ